MDKTCLKIFHQPIQSNYNITILPLIDSSLKLSRYSLALSSRSSPFLPLFFASLFSDRSNYELSGQAEAECIATRFLNGQIEATTIPMSRTVCRCRARVGPSFFSTWPGHWPTSISPRSLSFSLSLSPSSSPSFSPMTPDARHRFFFVRLRTYDPPPCSHFFDRRDRPVLPATTLPPP